MLTLLSVGVFAQNTMLRPVSGKSGNPSKSQPKSKPVKTVTTPTAQSETSKPTSNTKKTNVFLENAEIFSYDKDVMADGQLPKVMCVFATMMHICIAIVPIFLKSVTRLMPMDTYG